MVNDISKRSQFKTARDDWRRYKCELEVTGECPKRKVTLKDAKLKRYDTLNRNLVKDTKKEENCKL